MTQTSRRSSDDTVFRVTEYLCKMLTCLKEIYHLRDLEIDGKILLQGVLTEYQGVDWIHMNQDTDHFTGGNIHVFVKNWEFLDQLTDCCLLEEDTSVGLHCLHGDTVSASCSNCGQHLLSCSVWPAGHDADFHHCRCNIRKYSLLLFIYRSHWLQLARDRSVSRADAGTVTL